MNSFNSSEDRPSVISSTRRDPPEPHVALRDVTRTYDSPAGPFTALQDVSVEVSAGEFVTVTGPSGSGKSTLLNLVAGIDRPTAGEIRVGATAIHELGENELAVWRGSSVGIVFQFFQLLPTLTAVENVLLPMDFAGRWSRGERLPRALELLDRVGVADQADKLPETLSGGQRQRVAIARALANEPELVVADEPTGNLDSRMSEAVVELFGDLSAEGKTVIMVTHDRPAPLRDPRLGVRRIELLDGVVVADGPSPHA